MTALATLSIDIEARMARLEEGLDKAVRANQQAAKRVDQAWGAAGSVASGVLAGMAAAVSVAAIGNWVKSNLAAVDSLNDISDATGATVENISALQDIARRTGTEVGVVDTALVKLNAALNSAKPDSDQAKALQAIGLSATELRKLDPAEALREVAVALARFESDGNKARIVQELLGKSARELAPFLKDLGEAQGLTATMTKSQAEEAEKLVKALGALQASFAEVSQGLIADLAPALTNALRLFQEFRKGPGLGAALLEGLGGNEFKSAQDALTHYAAEIAKVQKTIDDMNSGAKPSRTIYGGDLMAEAVKERARLAGLANVYRNVVNSDGAGGGRGFVAPGAVPRPALPSLGTHTGGTRSGGGAVNELDAYIKKLEEATVRTADLSELTKVNLAEESGAFKGQSEARIQYLRDLAAGMDKLQEKSEEITVVIPEEEIQRVNDAFSLLDQTESAQISKLADLEAALRGAFASGLISAVQLGEGLDVLEKKLAGLQKPADQVLKKMRTLADDIKDEAKQTIGGSIKSALRGDFDEVGKMWENLLLDMVAKATQARITDALFAAPGGLPKLGDNLIGSFLGFFGLADGGAFSKGLQFYAQGDVFNAPTMFGHAGGLGVLGEAGPEAVMPLARGRGGKLGVMSSGGPSVTIIQHITINGGNRNELMLGMSVAKNAAVAEVSEILRRGGKV